MRNFHFLAAVMLLAALPGLAQNKPKSVVAATATRSAHKSDEASIRHLYDEWAKAFRAKNVDAIMSFYAPGDSVVAYDVVPPLQYIGFDAYKKDYADFLAGFNGPIEVEFRDMHVYAGGDVGFVHCLERIRGTMQDGKKVDMWLRATSGVRRIHGKWLIVHDHISVPANFDTGKAEMGLKP